VQKDKKKTPSFFKKNPRTPKCNPINCDKCIFLTMLQSDISGKGKIYGNIKIAKKNDMFHFTYYDKNISQMLGYSPQELIGKDPSEIIHPADKKMMGQRLRDRMQGKEVENEYLARLKRKEGKYIIVKIVGANPNDIKGHPEAEFIVSTYCLPNEKGT
jgi:PAS domain S-box-containing protein